MQMESKDIESAEPSLAKGSTVVESTYITGPGIHHGHVPSGGIDTFQTRLVSGNAGIVVPGAPNGVQTVIFLRPTAAPSALGFAAYFASTWIFSTYLCGWYGGTGTPNTYWPMIAIFGGIGQFVAGVRGFPARDNLATVFHTAWGSFFIAYGINALLMATGTIPYMSRYQESEELAMWFVTLAAITWICFLASFARDLATVFTLFLVGAGASVIFAGYFAGNKTTIKVGAYILMVSSLTALYRTLHFLVEEGFQRLPSWFPVFRTPWEMDRPTIGIPINEPGVKRAQ